MPATPTICKKTLLDSGTGVLWSDDRYVVHVDAYKAVGRPGFEMVMRWQDAVLKGESG